MTMTDSELRRALRCGKIRPFRMPHHDWATLQALVSADPSRYQVFEHAGKPALLRDNCDGTYTLFVQD
jgi:predicted ATPase with chaperone activity